MRTHRVPNVAGAFGFAVASLLAAAATAADGNITYLQDFSSSDRPMVLAASDRGVVLIGPGATVFRGYHHNQTARAGSEQAWLWVEDIDNDRQPEIVGAGSPTFVIESNGDPVWGILGGCQQMFLGDYIDSPALEVFCRQERDVIVRSYDGQLYFQWSGRGYNLGDCQTDDPDGDGKLEVSCPLSSGSQLRFDLDFTEPEEIDGTVEPSPQSGVNRRAAQAAIDGGTLRLNGQTWTLGFSGGALSIQQDGAQVASVTLPANEVFSAAVADLDRDGTAEFYVGGTDAVYVVTATGTLVGTVPANPTAFRRDARVTIRSATANNIENADRDAVRAIVEGGLSDLVGCYSSRMGADQFTRVGQMLYELQIGSSGSVEESNRRHSSLQNRDLESCIASELESLRFSPATGDGAVVNVTLDFDFVDVP